MITSYSSMLVLLYLSDISCNIINTTQFSPALGSNIDSVVNEISKIVATIESSRFGKASFVRIILPTVEDNTIMPQIIERTVQKLGTNWLITTSEGFCCDAYEISFLDPMKPPVFEYIPDFYIIPVREYDGLSYLDAQIQLMSEENTFNPRAVFLLITLTYQCGTYEDDNSTSLYFEQMWEMNCMSILFLVISECDFNITIVTATPFSDSNTCRKVQENGTKQYRTTWNKEEIDTSIYKNDRNNFNRCQFSVGTIPSPPHVVGKLDTQANETRYDFVGGIDVELLYFVSTVNNFTFVFDVHQGYGIDAMGRFLPNGKLAGMFVDVLQKTLDICVGGVIPFDYNFFRYDYSHCYKFSSFGWAVSDASLAPQWKIFLGAFSPDVWIISGFVFLVTSFLYSFLDKFIKIMFVGYRQKCIENLCVYCNLQDMPFIQYFSITLGLSSMLKPKRPCLRVLYFSWNIYSLHMCIAYSSMLFLLISNPPLGEEIKTVKDLQNSGLKVGSIPIIFRRFIAADLDSTTRKVMDNNFDCPKWEYCLEDIIKYKNFSLLITKDAFEYYAGTRKLKVHRISEDFFSYGASVLLSKGNPLTPGFNKLVLLAFQAGLVDKWERNTKLKFKIANVTDVASENSATVLTVSDLKGTFFVLGSGLLMSSMLLFGELVMFFVQRRIVDKQA